jgi:16S rRNA (guanine527-N7)-methyltransferase
MEAEALGVSLTPGQLASFEEFTRLLLDWNSRMNLTAITEPEEIATKHYADSLSLIPLLGSAKSVIDVGAGAGFPGIPLAIARPDISFDLIDSTSKRVAFLQEAISILNLENATCAHIRAQEAAMSTLRFERFDAAVSRALAKMIPLSALCLPFVKRGGFFYAMKGPSSVAEVEEAIDSIKSCGGRISSIKPVALKGGINHRIVVVEKVRSVPLPSSKKKKRN